MIYISLIADVATAVTVIIAMITFCDSKKTYEADKHHEKKKDTLDAYSRLQNEVFDKLFLEYKDADIEDISKHYVKRNEDYRKLSVYMAKIEHFSVGVITGIYDKDVVYELAHGFFDDKLRKALRPLIERKKSFCDYNPVENTEKVYELLDRITEKRRKSIK